MAIRTLVVTNDAAWLQHLRSSLSTSNEIEIVGEATNGPDAVKAAKELVPDIVFMDVRMPGMNGIEATRAIRGNDPNAKVILFTVEESQASVSDAIRAGVAGYLLKDSSAGELIHAAKRAHEGGAVIAPQLTKKFIEEAGPTVKGIAHLLHASPDRIESVVEQIFKKPSR